MKIVIPTAGFGTRLRPHTWSKPKPLVSVAGKPVLGHVLDMFQNLGKINEVVFIVGQGRRRQEYHHSGGKRRRQPKMFCPAHVRINAPRVDSIQSVWC